MSVNPKIWDNRKFVSLSDRGRLLFLHLITGYNGGVPGLIVGGATAYGEALRCSTEDAQMALSELVKSTLVEFDPESRLLRVPGRPKYVPCTNGNVVKGWLRRWRDLPESPLKYRHIESIRAALVKRKWFASCWEETFGTISIPENSRQVPLFHFEARETPGRENSEMETNRIPFPDVDSMSNLTTPATTTTTTTTTDTATTTERRDLDAYRAVADSIWQDQEDLTAELRAEGIDGRPLGMMNPAKVELVHRISERASHGGIENAELDCRHVLGVLIAEARAKQSTRWIDGAHWESRRFNMALARSVDDVNKPEGGDVRYGRVEPGDYASYPEPGAKSW